MAKQKSNQKKHTTSQIKKKRTAKKKTSKVKSSKKGKKGNTVTKQRSPVQVKNDQVKLADLATSVAIAPLNNNGEVVPEKTITIISAFKPQLKHVSKMSFGNAALVTDTTTLNLSYQVPSQNLTFQYKPISLIPRAVKITFSRQITQSGTAKLGYGNFYHHLIDLTYSLVDTKGNTHTLIGTTEASQGLHHLQSTNQLGLNYMGNYQLDSLNSIQTSLYYNTNKRFRYGMVPDSSVLPNSIFKQNTTSIGAKIGWLNFNTQKRLITLRPTLQLENFSGVGDASNTTLEFKSPITFSFKNNLNINFDLAYSYSDYKSSTGVNSNNSILRFDPSFNFKFLKTKVLLGVSPTIANGVYSINPNILVSRKLKDTNYVFVGGWNTTVSLNKYADLTASNPWIGAPSELKNTFKESKFITIIINSSKRLDYSFGFEFNDYKNIAFFNKMALPVDKTINGLMYETLFESRAKTIEFIAKCRYQFSDKLLITNKLSYIQFSSIRINNQAWGILPLLIQYNANWVANDKLSFDGGLQFWSGAHFSTLTNGASTTQSTLLLNAALNYKLSPRWNAWVKGENLLDKPYERWANYPSLGVQLMAGIVYSFR